MVSHFARWDGGVALHSKYTLAIPNRCFHFPQFIFPPQINAPSTLAPMPQWSTIEIDIDLLHSTGNLSLKKMLALEMHDNYIYELQNSINRR